MQANKSKIKVFPSYVNSKEVGSIRDSGATAIIVKASLVEPGQYLEDTVKVTYANIQKFDICKTAKVLIESPWITGELEAIVMDTPAQDLIIGNVDGVKDPTLEEVMQWAEDRQKYSLFKHEALLAQTRSHKKITPEIECPTVLLNEIGITREELIIMQKNDTTIQDLLSKDYNKINLNNHHIEINNLAIRYNRKENCTRLQILIPKTLRAKILNMAHDDPTAGHLGKKKVYAKIANKFFWPKMGKDIKNYVNSCTECAKQKTVTRAPLEKSDKSHYFWDKIAMDIMGPLTTSSKGNKYILGIIDMSTRWAEAFPLKDIKAIDICNCLKTLFLKFGFPNKLLSDNASNFKSHLNQAFAEMTNIRLVHSTIYSPQGNGVIEKWNRTVKQMIYKLERDSMSTWDQTLSYAIFAYNTSIHETTKFSPYELVFNRKPKGPLELWADNMLDLENIEQYHPWIIQTKQQLRQGIKLIENKHCKDKNEGPFKVIERINNKVYIIDKDGRECKLNIDKLVKLDKRQITDTDIIELDVETKHNIQEHIVSTINTTHNSSPNIENDTLQNLTVKYSDVITQKLGCTNLIEHTIKLNKALPTKTKAYSIPKAYEDLVRTEMTNLIKDGKIERSETCKYASPMVIVKKKDSGVRICCDFREINKCTVIDPEPLPDTDSIITTLSKSSLFTTMDLNRGFWQIKMDPDSKEYTAFKCTMPGLEGIYVWNVMPFGLINSTATFQKCMSKLLEGINKVLSYVDDICVFTNSQQEHIHVLEQIFIRLRTHNMTLSPKKLNLAKPEIQFLGYCITNDKITPTETNLTKIKNIKEPRTKKDMRSLLGLCNFYRKFIPNYAQIIEPLVEFTKKKHGNTICIDEKSRLALSNLKDKFNEKLELASIDPTSTLSLYTDASNTGIGACLLQQRESFFKPIVHISRTLSETERKYSVIEKELLAIVWSVVKLKNYLLGRYFSIKCDHKPLLALKRKELKNDRINRWTLILSDYKFDLESIPGHENVIADFLSRYIIHENEASYPLSTYGNAGTEPTPFGINDAGYTNYGQQPPLGGYTANGATQGPVFTYATPSTLT
ncbi:uncharacterized protein LOC106067276 [Biomphalaria glabrata]|uniref:Uncharacterized protein LOC106067276 n=1 Tax=Biomphalaria glabrata TaxID=6526 RepID=A0A9W2ZHS2_BIOGL|nr:uncharacterized protein LOC106067276 [Biomphalaria glabrata]